MRNQPQLWSAPNHAFQNPPVLRLQQQRRRSSALQRAVPPALTPLRALDPARRHSRRALGAARGCAAQALLLAPRALVLLRSCALAGAWIRQFVDRVRIGLPAFGQNLLNFRHPAVSELPSFSAVMVSSSGTCDPEGRNGDEGVGHALGLVGRHQRVHGSPGLGLGQLGRRADRLLKRLGAAARRRWAPRLACGLDGPRHQSSKPWL